MNSLLWVFFRWSMSPKLKMITVPNLSMICYRNSSETEGEHTTLLDTFYFGPLVLSTVASNAALQSNQLVWWDVIALPNCSSPAALWKTFGKFQAQPLLHLSLRPNLNARCCPNFVLPALGVLSDLLQASSSALLSQSNCPWREA